VAAFGGILGLQLGRNGLARAPKLPDSREHYAPMPEQHADVLKVLIGQMAKCCETNPVFSKTLRVLGHAELFEPVGSLLHRGPLGTLHSPLWTDRTESLPHAPTYCSVRSRVACPIRANRRHHTFGLK